MKNLKITTVLPRRQPSLRFALIKTFLKAAMGAWREFRDETLREENKHYQFISYKQYVWWCYGYLGKNKRKPLLNCVITKIWEIYPEESDNYVPYKTGRLRICGQKRQTMSFVYFVYICYANDI